jgi:diacylglycerol kinase (ATP)
MTRRSIVIKRCLVISNPAAGRVTQSLVARAGAMLSVAGVDAVLYEATSPEDARNRARDASLDSGLNAVIAAGGDGTLRDVASGLVGNGGPTGPAFGILPLGTTNVLARELAIPFDLQGAVRIILEGRVGDLFLGIANGAYFMTMAGVGFDASVVATVDRELKRSIGRGAYVVAAMQSLINLPRHEFEIHVVGQGTFRAASVVVAKSLYYGGSFSCAPQARVDRPELHFCLFKKPGAVNAMLYAAALGARRLTESDRYQIVIGQEGTITGPAGLPVQVDGDVVTSLPLHVAVASAPLAVLRPD